MSTAHLCPRSKSEVGFRGLRGERSLDLRDPTHSELARDQHTRAPCHSTARHQRGSHRLNVDHFTW